ncbi:MAG TPA: hypothetical protein VLH15_08140 [Dehalococcoidales bacterium]|nr:hypothetical protein [Dehalococcoidales bacterium]
MKRIITVLSMVVILSLMLAMPAMAGSPQVWQLDAEMTTAGFQMEKNGGPGDDGQTGQVIVGAGQSFIWIADQVALANVTFSSGHWKLDLVSDADWGTQADLLYAEVGQWDGTTFTMLEDDATLKSVTPQSPPGVLIIEVKVQSGAITINNGNWLALRLTNNSNLARTVYTGEGNEASCVTSPNTDPGYPIPELAAGILLGAGVLGLGGYLLMRRKKALVA